MPLFGDFDYNTTDDNTEQEQKGYDLMSYADYIQETEEKKKKKTKKPKEQDNDLLKIIKFDTNKSKIKLRHLQEKNIIPAHPFRLLLVGRSGSGKSMNLVNLMTRPHMYGRTNPNNPKSHYFNIIFLFSPTAEGGDDLADHLELTDNRIVSNEAKFVPTLQHILKTQKDLIGKNGLL